MIMCSVLISDGVCRRPSWTPKTQPSDSSAVVWLSFWCSTQLLMSLKKCLSYCRKTCTPHPVILLFNHLATICVAGRLFLRLQCSLHQIGHLLTGESSWTPKTQPNDSRAAVWLIFWFSTRPSADTVTNYTFFPGKWYTFDTLLVIGKLKRLT